MRNCQAPAMVHWRNGGKSMSDGRGMSDAAASTRGTSHPQCRSATVSPPRSSCVRSPIRRQRVRSPAASVHRSLAGHGSPSRGTRRAASRAGARERWPSSRPFPYPDAPRPSCSHGCASPSHARRVRSVFSVYKFGPPGCSFSCQHSEEGTHLARGKARGRREQLSA